MSRPNIYEINIGKVHHCQTTFGASWIRTLVLNVSPVTQTTWPSSLPPYLPFLPVADTGIGGPSGRPPPLAPPIFFLTTQVTSRRHLDMRVHLSKPASRASRVTHAAVICAVGCQCH